MRFVEKSQRFVVKYFGYYQTFIGHNYSFKESI